MRTSGGTVTSQNGTLNVTNADAVTLLISVGTNYTSHRDLTGDQNGRALTPLQAAGNQSYDQLRTSAPGSCRCATGSRRPRWARRGRSRSGRRTGTPAPPSRPTGTSPTSTDSTRATRSPSVAPRRWPRRRASRCSGGVTPAPAGRWPGDQLLVQAGGRCPLLPVTEGPAHPRAHRPHLFCLHPPFQIDGNFGATAGIAYQLAPRATTVISLRSRPNNQYVCAENGGAAALIANRTTIGTAESFDLVTG